MFRATEGLKAKYGGRLIDSPLAESSIIGLSIGAAHYGMRPVAEIQFADFIHSGFDQLCSEASRWCYRTNGEATLPMVVRTPWGGGVHGGQHHSQSIEAYYTHMPGLKVVAPSFPADYRSLLKARIADPNPVIFLEHKRTYRLIRQEVEGAPAEDTLGRARVTRKAKTSPSSPTASCSTNPCRRRNAPRRRHRMHRRGPPHPPPARCRNRPRNGEGDRQGALIVHEDTLTGGFGGEIAALIAEHAFEYLDAPIRRLAGPDIPAMPFAHAMESFFMPDREKIAAAARDLAAY